MESGHLTSRPSGDGTLVYRRKLTLSLLDLPNELLLLIFGYLGEDELFALSMLSRRLHHAALPIYMVCCGLSKSSLFPEKLVLFIDQALAPEQKRGILLLQTSFDITSVKHITFEFHFPRNTFFKEIRNLHRLMEKLTSVEEVILDFNNVFSLSCTDRDPNDEVLGDWDNWSRQLHALLDTVASKSSNLTVRQLGPFPPTSTIMPAHNSSHHRNMTIISRPVTFLQKIVGTVVEKPLLSRPVQGESAHCPDIRDGQNRLPSAPALNTLTIASPMLFHPSFLLWTTETLNNSPIHTLSFDFVKLTTNGWSDILPLITLRVLSVLSIDLCDIAFTDLSAFLSRHPSLTTLNIGARTVDLDRYSQPSLPKQLPQLPQLTTVSAPTSYAVLFLTSARAFPKLRLTTIVSHVSFASDFGDIERAVASVAEHQLTNVALSLELHVHPNWLDLGAGLRIGGANTLEQRVTSLVINAGWYGLENHVRHRLPGWLARLRALDNLTFIDQSKWPLDTQVKLTLIRSISAACPNVKTIVVNNEAHDIGAWLAM